MGSGRRVLAAPAASELAIAALVVAIIAMLIVPLPRAVLDALLALNLGLSAALLMTALFTPRPVEFSAFPTLLVITTLFRVGLEVSMTRLILADADAGAIVGAFGGAVVAGNLVIGLVVFAVITVVQLLVVARGAERVAEVAARFALDAMPGKQMAIDGELRAGAIDAEAARQRRGDLERASQLYGAMDGAMRFIKGDAIAAIAIVAINLIGGLVIGVAQRGLSVEQAMRTYSLLSIGEGLVAQIPALVVAVASGLLVTRVASGGDRAIGHALAPLGAEPRALAGVAALLVGLGLVPGLPFPAFAALGALAAAGAVAAARARPAQRGSLDEPGAGAGPGPRLALQVCPALHAELAALAPAHRAELAAVRHELAARTGVPVPPVAIELAPALGREAGPGSGGGGGGPEAGPAAALAIDGIQVAWIAGPTWRDVLRVAPEAIAPLAAELLTVDGVAALVERAAAATPAVVREVVPRIVALAVLTEVLRTLAREQVPLGDLAAILEAIAIAPAPAGGFTGSDAARLVEHVRGRLRRQISARWAPKGRLAIYTVDAMIEDAVRTSIDRAGEHSGERAGEHSGGPAVLALEPEIANDIIAAVRAEVGTGPAVILTSGDIRRHLRALLSELPDVAILTAHELTPGTAIDTVGRIEI